MGHTLARAAAITGIIFVVAGCSITTPPAAGTGAAASAAASNPAAQPENATAARAAAQQYFGLYGAGQYTTAYGLLASPAQHTVDEQTWAAVHQRCIASTGLAYQVSTATLTGNTAVVSVSLAGAASSLASESVALTYSGGRWGIDPSDLSIYKHGSVSADLAAAKAAGYCSSN